MRTSEIQASPPKVEEFAKMTQSRTSPQVEKIPITKARAMISKLINRVHVDKERIVLEKSGMPVAALIDIDEFKQFLAFREASEAK